jgi:hypothetical protein
VFTYIRVHVYIGPIYILVGPRQIGPGGGGNAEAGAQSGLIGTVDKDTFQKRPFLIRRISKYSTMFNTRKFIYRLKIYAEYYRNLCLVFVKI